MALLISLSGGVDVPLVHRVCEAIAARKEVGAVTVDVARVRALEDRALGVLVAALQRLCPMGYQLRGASGHHQRLAEYLRG